MGKPLMIQQADDDRIDALKTRLQARTKIEVVRCALALLERETERREKAEQWKLAAARVARESRTTLREFRPHTRLDRIDV